MLRSLHASPMVLAVLALLAAGCGGSETDGTPAVVGTAGLPQGADLVSLDPASFTTRIDNPWWPMHPGSRWIFREANPGERPMRVVVTVTDRTREIANGVRARVVHDVVTRGRATVEDTYDWYAQDRAGNVWYLGEDTKEYAYGKVSSTAGSWEAGVDGAQPGIVVPAAPRPGLHYRQEYLKGEAEDRAVVLSLAGQARVPAGRYDGLLTTRDSTPLEPAATERKYYARGVGPLLSVALANGGREALVGYAP